MKRKTYIINGDPIPLARARFCNTQGHKIWDSQKEIKTISQISIESQNEGVGQFEGPLRLEANFFFQMPDSWSTKKKEIMLSKPHIFRPDLDNLVKFICDICNELVYHDDSRICEICARKLYSDKPRTEFTLIELNPQRIKMSENNKQKESDKNKKTPEQVASEARIRTVDGKCKKD